MPRTRARRRPPGATDPYRLRSRRARPYRQVAEEHYKDLASKPFYKDLVQYILSGPVVAMVRPRLRVYCV